MVSSGRITLSDVLAALASTLIVCTILAPLLNGASNPALQAESVRRLGQGILAYAQDHDDLFPLAFGSDAYGQARAAQWHSVPEGWRPGPWSEEPRVSQDVQFWANSTRPYYVDTSLLAIQGAPERRVSGVNYDNPVRPYLKIGLTYNGMLHSWSRTAVAAPSALPLLWEGFGRLNMVGLDMSQPMLWCFNSNPCRFNPTGPPQTGDVPAGPFGSPGAAGFLWMGLSEPWPAGAHIGGGYYLSTDLTLQERPLEPNAGVGPNGPFTHPSSAPELPAGQHWMTECSTLGQTQALYPCYFRPDTTPDMQWAWRQ